MQKAIFVALLFVSGLLSAQTYTITTPVTGLPYPVAFDFAPDGRYFISLKGDDGVPNLNAKIVVYNSSGSFLSTFYDLSDSTISDFERGVLGITLDPAFAVNHFVYVYYNHLYNGNQAIRVVRFTENNNIGTDPLILLHIPVGTIPGNHVGGNIHFRPSEPTKLYVSIGELGTPANSQVVTNPFGKFLRINSDGTIPSDNPFYDDGNPGVGNDDRIWTYGHRNNFDFTFSPVTDTMYSSENGASTWDEVDVIMKGQNYGWRQCEGNYVYGSSTTLCQTTYPSHIEPIAVWASPLPALTGILYYSGNVMPEFNNHLLVADNNYGRIHDLTLSNGPAYDGVSSNVVWQDLPGGLTTLRQGPEGCIYAMKGGYTTSGNISRICPQGLSADSEIKKAIYLEIAPNPFNDKCNVQISSYEPGDMELIIVNVLGETVKHIFKGEISKVKTFELEREEMCSGVYFISLSYTTASGYVSRLVRKVVVE